MLRQYGEREPSNQHGHDHHGHGHDHGHSPGHKKYGCVNDVPTLVQNMKWKENETVLDYGCGVGQNLMEFVFPIIQKNGSKIFGVDCAPEAIQRAKEKFPDNTDIFLVGDVMSDDDKWPLKDQQFDKVIAVHSLYMDFGEFLKKIRTHLKDGGQIATSWPMPNELDVWKILANFPKYGPEFAAVIPNPLWLSDPEEVRRVVLANGFSISFIEVTPIAHTLSDGAHFIGMYGAVTNPVTEKMSEEERAQLREYMNKEVNLAMNLPADHTGPMDYNRQSIRIVIEKV